jgi:hypothetical protein
VIGPLPYIHYSLSANSQFVLDNSDRSISFKASVSSFNACGLLESAYIASSFVIGLSPNNLISSAASE